MNSSPCLCKDEIRALAAGCGAAACGFAVAAPVDDAAAALYDNWLTQGRHGTMTYCERYADVRRDPRLLLDGAATLIVCAFNYLTDDTMVSEDDTCGDGTRLGDLVSVYARGRDYHRVVRERLERLATEITGRWGGTTRAVVDTAPLRERYWAQRAGIGFTALNNQLVVVTPDGETRGSYHFIGTLLWTVTVEPDQPCTRTCDGCLACARACPGGALDGEGGCDASRCLSYLTIEHRGALPDGLRLGRNAYGCDVCQRVCPLNAGAAPTQAPDFAPDTALMSLTTGDLRAMTSSRFKRLTRDSAMSRITLDRMLRNIDAL